jgi:hypothetical protein
MLALRGRFENRESKAFDNHAVIIGGLIGEAKRIYSPAKNMKDTKKNFYKIFVIFPSFVFCFGKHY